MQAIWFSCVHLLCHFELGRLGTVPLFVGNLLYLSIFFYAAGYLARSSRSLYPSIVLHAMNGHALALGFGIGALIVGLSVASLVAWHPR